MSFNTLTLPTVASLALAGSLVVAQANSITAIPTLGGSMVSATDLNNAGQVVGFSMLEGDMEQHAFLFSGGVMTDLGTLGGSSSLAVTINNAGQIAGDASTDGNAATHAFLYSNGAMSSLGSLGGTFSTPLALNDRGEVAGYSFLGGDAASHAFLFSSGTLTDLGTLGGVSSSANAINNLGQVAGDATTANHQTHAFLYSDNTLTDLGTLGGPMSLAWAINDHGVVVGESDTANGETHAFLHSNGTMLDLGTLGGSYSYAVDVNASGMVVGDSTTPGDLGSHGFLYAGGVMIDLGTLGGSYSFVNDINNHGQIVGDATDASEMMYPFLWHNGAMVNLNDLLPENSGWEVWSAFRINDNGQILGYGLHNGAFGYYLLTLQSQNQPPVAHAGTDQSTQCPGNVALDGSASSDPDGDSLSFAWSLNGATIASGPNPVVHLGFGTHTLTVTVTDPAGASDQDTVTVTVADTMPPTVTCPVSRSAEAGNACSAPAPDLTASVVATDNCTSSSALSRVQSPAPGTLLPVGTHTLTVTVTDQAGNAASCDTPFTVTDAQAPVITQCPPPASAPADAGGLATVPNFTSNLVAADNCSANGLAVSQSPAPGTRLGPGTHTVTLAVTDAAGNTASCATSFTVADVTPPTFTCPAPVSIHAGRNESAPAPNLLEGLVARDNVTPASRLTATQAPAAGTPLRAGSHQVVVTVSDAAGNAASCATTVTVTVDTPCELVVHAVTPNPKALWPVNNKMVAVAVSVRAESSCGAVASKITRITSSEPATGKGDNTSPDYVITGPLSAELRAERAGGSEGRVYTLTIETTDAAGNRAVHTVHVEVPKNKPADDLLVQSNKQGNKGER